MVTHREIILPALRSQYLNSSNSVSSGGMSSVPKLQFLAAVTEITSSQTLQCPDDTITNRIRREQLLGQCRMLCEIKQ